MKSLYSKRRPYFDLIFGVLYTGLGVSYFYMEDDDSLLTPYAVSSLGVVYILLFLYEFRKNN